MTTLESTRQYLAKRLGMDARLITPESAFTLDGPTRLDLLVDVEKAFGIELSHECGHITTLGELLIVVAWELAQAHVSRKE